MSPAPIIVDTNVVVAGLLTSDTSSPVAQILDGMLRGAFPFVLSEALLAEYRAVLLRPPLRSLHKLNNAEIDTLLTAIANNAIVLKPAISTPAPDKGDQLLWDLLAARADLILITGDKPLRRDRSMSARIRSAREFVDATADR